MYAVSTNPKEMALGVGRILTGRKGVYQLVEELVASTVFKARVLPESTIKPGLYGPMTSK